MLLKYKLSTFRDPFGANLRIIDKLLILKQFVLIYIDKALIVLRLISIKRFNASNECYLPL